MRVDTEEVAPRRWLPAAIVDDAVPQRPIRRPQCAHYVASTGGVIALAEALAYELSPQKITANTIPPSIIDTPMAQAGTEARTIAPLDIWPPWCP